MLRATIIYAVAASLLAVVVSGIATYVLNWYDPKFRDALGMAFQAQLIAEAVFVIVASTVFAISFQLLPTPSTQIAAWRIALAGAIYPVGTMLLGQVLDKTDPESWINPAVGWLYMVAYPLLAAFLVRR